MTPLSKLHQERDQLFDKEFKATFEFADGMVAPPYVTFKMFEFVKSFHRDSIEAAYELGKVEAKKELIVEMMANMGFTPKEIGAPLSFHHLAPLPEKWVQGGAAKIP